MTTSENAGGFAGGIDEAVEKAAERPNDGGCCGSGAADSSCCGGSPATGDCCGEAPQATATAARGCCG
jgi:hypothetical protein